MFGKKLIHDRFAQDSAKAAVHTAKVIRRDIARLPLAAAQKAALIDRICLASLGIFYNEIALQIFSSDSAWSDKVKALLISLVMNESRSAFRKKLKIDLAENKALLQEVEFWAAGLFKAIKNTSEGESLSVGQLVFEGLDSSLKNPSYYILVSYNLLELSALAKVMASGAANQIRIRAANGLAV